MIRSFALIIISIILSSTIAIAGWTPMGSGTTYWLNGIWGSSATDVYAVGREGLTLHYDGTSWSEIDSMSQGQSLWAIWGSSATNIFAVGLEVIIHYDGNTWSEMEEPNNLLFDIWGSSATDVFAVSDSKVLHYDGNSWSEIFSKIPSPHFQAIWGSSTTDVFAVGHGTIFHYDGTTWEEMESNTTRQLQGVWGTSPTDVFAVGLGVILHYDGNTWSEMETDIEGYLDGIWGSSPTDVFAVGSFDIMDTSLILHYDGNTWSEMEHPTVEHLADVWGSSVTDVFAVSGDGTILHYDGTNCNLCPLSLIYGSDSYKVELPRSIRDNVLSQSPEGRELIKLYYQWSPVIVQAIEADEDFKAEVKDIVDGVLPMIQVVVE